MDDDPDDDRLLRDLASLAREEEAHDRELLDDRWDRLAAGELSPEEGARLAAEAEGSEEARLAYESFRPLGATFQSRVAAQVLAEQGKAKGGLARSQVPFPPARATRPKRAEPSLPRRTLWRWGWRGLVAAAALAGAVVVGPQLFVPPFPAYELALLPEGEATERSLEAAPDEAPALFHPGTAFEVAVRPLVPIDDLHGTLEVRCLLQDGARVRSWPACAERAEIAPTRAVRIAGTLGEDLSLEPGTWTLWVVLGRQGKIADFEHRPALLNGSSVAKRDWIALRVPRTLRMEPLP
jgi:hypothetical protein